MTAMLKGPRRLGPTEQLLLARWALKVAMLAECLKAPDRRPFSFTQHDRDQIREGHTPPNRAIVWLAGVRSLGDEFRKVGSIFMDTMNIESAELTVEDAQTGVPILGASSSVLGGIPR